MDTAPTPDASLAQLLRWLEQGGAQITSKVHIISTGGGERGVFALEDVAAEELIARIPRQRLIFPQEARASDIGRLLEKHTGADDQSLFLEAFLLQELERGADSPWKPFLDVLPRSYPTHPLFFQARELSMLKGSFLLELLTLEREGLEEKYASLCEQVPGYARFTFEEFLWANVTVTTRIFGAKLNGEPTNCLVPFVDLINDGLPWNARWGWSSDGECFEVIAISAIPRGKEVRTTYGAKGNFQMLRNYGFVHEHNPNNEVMVPFELPQGDSLMEEKCKWVGITDPSLRHTFSLPLMPDARRLIELFSDLRILHAQAEEMALLKSAPDLRTRAKEPLSPSNEAQVLLALAGACKAHLAGYETSLEEDARLLKEGNLSWNDRNCIIVRMGEKQILQVFAQAAD
jgi:protein-histidine N-methyltransferase